MGAYWQNLVICRGGKNDWPARKVVWANENEHTPCLFYKKYPDARCHLALRLSRLMDFFGLLSAKLATFEMWHYVWPFLNKFLWIFFESVVFGSATNYYLLWGHEAARWWGMSIGLEWEDWSFTYSSSLSRHYL